MDRSSTRIGDLQGAVDQAQALIDRAEALLDPLLAALTEEQRRSLPRAPVRFQEAGRALAAVAPDAPDLASRAGFDPAVVIDDLDKAALLAPLTARLADLQRRLDDSRLQWIADAYVPSLRLYRLGKACAAHDGRVESLVTPLGEVFAATRRPRRTSP